MTTTIYTCSVCGKTQEAKRRIPRDWKRLGLECFCPLCLHKRYVLQAITMPVVSPLDCEWSELRSELKKMWAATTQASNWLVTELYTRDVRRIGDEKMPPMPHIYLYPEARVLFPELPSNSLSALAQTIQRKYRAVRYEVIWTRRRSLPTFRYPAPFPIANRSWHAEWYGETPSVSVRIGKNRVRLRLKGGPGFRRQRRAYDAIISGDAVQGELSIYPVGANIMCKLISWQPRTNTVKGLSGVLHVRTADDSLLVALDEKTEKLWIYNGDHIVRWSVEHRRQLRRWAQDQKYENGPNATFQKRREAAVVKYRSRMNSACHEISAQLAGYASRRRFESVLYDDTEHGFCEQFPWADLRRLLAEKLDRVGVRLELASGKAETEEAEPLAAQGS